MKGRGEAMVRGLHGPSAPMVMAERHNGKGANGRKQPGACLVRTVLTVVVAAALSVEIPDV